MFRIVLLLCTALAIYGQNPTPTPFVGYTSGDRNPIFCTPNQTPLHFNTLDQRMKRCVAKDTWGNLVDESSTAAFSKAVSINGWTFLGALAALPATCSVGQSMFLTTGSINAYNCTNADTWTAGTGGGSLTVQLDGAAIGTRPNLNFAAGTNTSLSASDNGTDTVTVTVNSTGGGHAISFSINAGGAVIPAGQYAGAVTTIGYNCSLSHYNLKGDGSVGSATVDVWKAASGAIPTVAGKISTTPMTIASDTKTYNAVPSDWTSTSYVPGDTFTFNVLTSTFTVLIGEIVCQ